MSDRLGYTETQYRLFRSHAWRFLVFFSFVYCAHYCTRLNLTNAAAVLIEGLSWSKADIGFLAGILFWTYGLGQLVSGRAGEHVGPGLFAVLGVSLSIAANLAMSFQTSLWAMALIWGANGFFQSMVWTPGLAILTRWWPGNQRGFATGFLNAFSGFGQVLVLLSLAAAITYFPELGWRSVFLIPTVFPLVALAAFLLFAKTKPESVGLPPYEEGDAGKRAKEAEMRQVLSERGFFYPYAYLLRNRVFVLWLCIMTLMGMIRYGVTTWIPLYFVDRFGIDVTSGILSTIALPLGMGIGTFVVPFWTDKYCPENRFPAVIGSASLGFLAIVFFVFLDPRVPLQFVLVEVLLFVAGFCIYGVNGTSWAYATDVGGRVFTGTSSGMLDFSAYMGAGMQALVFGSILESVGWTWVFCSIGSIFLVILSLGLAAKRRAASDMASR